MNSALDTILLPQYALSEEFMERFLEAIHKNKAPIIRSANTGKIKTVDQSELNSDYLIYFSDHKTELENEFFDDLEYKIGRTKTEKFCNIISEHWYDGHKKRNSADVKSLEWAIRCYIEKKINIEIKELVINDIEEPKNIIFTVDDINNILITNHQNLYQHITKWLENHPNLDLISRDDIYFRRGLRCKSIFSDEVTYNYRENSFINSYSIAFSAPEQFTKRMQGKVPIIVNGNCDFFENRILFFSPFIKGMDCGQLEFGIIPNTKTDELIYQGKHSGIHEYLFK